MGLLFWGPVLGNERLKIELEWQGYLCDNLAIPKGSNVQARFPLLLGPVIEPEREPYDLRRGRLSPCGSFQSFDGGHLLRVEGDLKLVGFFLRHLRLVIVAVLDDTK